MNIFRTRSPLDVPVHILELEYDQTKYKSQISKICLYYAIYSHVK